MMTELFDQFMIPELLGIKLLPIAMMMPVLFTYQSHQIRTNRLTSLITLLIKKTTKHLFTTMSSFAYMWALILITTIMFIATTNILGLLPYTFTPTTQLSMNMAMAMPLWMATVTIGLRNQPTKSLSHFLPEGTPTLLIPALIIIETISLFIRPLALGVRLTANLTAGHLLMQLTSMAVMKTSLILFPTMLAALVLLTILEVAVALIQAYVFTLLLSLYLQENTH
uniref:ATP synthase subunit a n=1 Tax=Chamaeleo dilepis TaxID=91908 RepID=B7S681_CHADI|nr:ATP synthase F0 subunit 6 [Chamaeleo dilepis]ABM90414.1 ATP synthase F0 subunit 6 [Chamaeleo dilepis]